MQLSTLVMSGWGILKLVAVMIQNSLSLQSAHARVPLDTDHGDVKFVRKKFEGQFVRKL